jgi:hypothetical protein
MRSNHIIALMALLAASGASRAADGTVGELARVQAETTLLKAQLERQDVATKMTAGGGTSPGSTILGVTPFVGGVFGRTGHLYATLLYADGSRVDARAGSTVPGGYRVVTLTAERVELIGADGRRVLAAFSAAPPAPPAPPVAERATSAPSSAKPSTDTDAD